MDLISTLTEYIRQQMIGEIGADDNTTLTFLISIECYVGAKTTSKESTCLKGGVCKKSYSLREINLRSIQTQPCLQSALFDSPKNIIASPPPTTDGRSRLPESGNGHEARFFLLPSGVNRLVNKSCQTHYLCPPCNHSE
jgi:hypothetical protein